MADTDSKPQFWDEAWGRVEDNLKALIVRGIHDVAQLIAVMDHLSEGGDEGALRNRMAEALRVPRDERGIPLAKLWVVGGRYTLVPAHARDETLVETIIAEIGEATTAVAELGSGWGHNLFRIHVRAPYRKVRYLACERAESGRRASRLVGALAERMNLEVHPFDFRTPSFPFLDRDGETLVFTCHAIEQVTTLGVTTFERLLDATEACRGVHLEPVGWQRDAGLLRAAAEGRLEPVRGGEADRLRDELVHANAAAWAAERGYNRDLIEVLEILARSGRIRIRRVVEDLVGTNPLNPSTLIVWEKVTQRQFSRDKA